ncbi:hypothetical protein FA15DRAFT_261543 [Coprinopsis marcescibilis]|uniref:Uncharacterized protein n=1 Tax=Coprinopsis marcescibilis TaxID=230819 RepID=A0A5C3KE16_COPMA|nr:hypothetical protein FA15DRAFT_261543 [Coprinopsis marcescibilis]
MSDPLHTLDSARRSINEPFKKAGDAVHSIRTNHDEPLHEPLKKVEQTSTAAHNILNRRFDPHRGPHSAKAQKIVFIKGIFDVFLSLSPLFFPSLLYDGPLSKVVSMITTLRQPSWEGDTSSVYALSALIMGAGFAGICAAESTHDDAYKVIATLNGVFAVMCLLGCILDPHKYGSTFLLLAGLQDVAWFWAIVEAGGYGVLDTLGLSFRSIRREVDRIARKDSGRDVKGAVGGNAHGQPEYLGEPVSEMGKDARGPTKMN